MNLEVYLETGQVGKVTGIINSPILDVTDEKPENLLRCEMPGDLTSTRFSKYNALASPWPLPQAGKVGMPELEGLTLRVRLPNNSLIYITVGDVINRKQGIVAHNFTKYMKRWRDLIYLPRFNFTIKDIFPQSNELTEESISFLDSITHVLFLNLDKDHERELAEEFRRDPRYLVYNTWNQLALDVGWLAVDFLTLEHRLLPKRGNIARRAMILEMRENISSHDMPVFMLATNGAILPIAGTEPRRNGNSQGQVYTQMSHEQFVEEHPELECHSRDARNWYYETDPEERTKWICYDPDSVWNEEIPNDPVTQGHINSKASRDLRYDMVMDLFHLMLTQCDALQRFEFSKHFWMEEGRTDMGFAQDINFTIHFNELNKPPTIRTREANVYTRWGPQLTKLSNNDFNGPGLRYELSAPHFATQADIIGNFHRQLFSANRRWLNSRQGLTARADKLHKSKVLDERRKEADLRAIAEHMGVFLTQTQLSMVRRMINYLYDRFNVPKELRRPTEERFQVSESRLNDLAEESRVLEGKLALLMHELTMSSNLHDIRRLQALQNRLLRNMQGNIQQQKKMLQTILVNEPLSEATKQRLREIETKDGELTMDSLEMAVGSLEVDTWQMCDPSYAFFDPNLSTSKLVFGKMGLAQRLERLKERMQQAPDQRRAHQLAHLLRNIENRLDYCQRADTVYIEDLTIAI